MPYFRHAMKRAAEEAGEDGTVMFAVIMKKKDGSGRIVADFRAPEFFDDIARICDLPLENTEEETLDAQALEMLDKLGLRPRT